MNFIPERIASAQRVNALENDAFQEWLMELVAKEDLVRWANSDYEPTVIMSFPEPKREYRFISKFIP